MDLRPTVRNHCIVITVFSIAAVGLTQPYLPRGGALEYSLIGTVSLIAGLVGHMLYRNVWGDVL